MAILGLIVASEVLNDKSYLEQTHLAADYLINMQDPSDGAWYDQYSYIDIVAHTKSPTQTAEIMIALYKLGYDHHRYNAMKNGAKYLVECQKVENKGGNDDGLICGGKDDNGQFLSWRWTHDNSYSYWALKAAEVWAIIENDMSFATECTNSAQKIIDGINTYLYNSTTGAWYIAIDENGMSQWITNLDGLASWIQYAPQMLDLPANGVNSITVGEWIHDTFQQSDGSCIGYEYDGIIRTRKYPGLSFQASLCWFVDTGHTSHADAAINWAENSGLWQTTSDLNGITGGWIDWIEVSPETGKRADWWLRFIDTSFYAIASWDGGYNFKVSSFPTPDIKANGSDSSITITPNDNLSVTIKIDPGSFLGKDADWYVAADTPFGWYYYDVIGGCWCWKSGLSCTYQWPLFNLTPFEVLNISGLPKGTYTLYFGVDLNMNCLWDDSQYYDSVVAKIE